MPGPLKNIRHEAFCKGIIAKNSATEAYLQAGYNVPRGNARVNGCKLLTKSNITQRIQELSAATGRKFEITRLKVLDMLVEDRELARKLEMPAAAVRASELLGKEIGMFRERVEVGEAGAFDKLSDDQLLAELERLRPLIEGTALPQLEHDDGADHGVFHLVGEGAEPLALLLLEHPEAHAEAGVELPRLAALGRRVGTTPARGTRADLLAELVRLLRMTDFEQTDPWIVLAHKAIAKTRAKS
jgi:hypothetical protein